MSSIPIKREYTKLKPQYKKPSSAGYYAETETRVWTCKSCEFKNSARTICIKCRRPK